MKNYLKKKFVVYGSFIIILSIFSLIYTGLVYFQKITPLESNHKSYILIIGGVSFLILGFISGIVASKNGLLEGFISGLIVILISLLINIFVRNPFELKTLIKIAIYLLSSSLGGVLGINLKSKNK